MSINSPAALLVILVLGGPAVRAVQDVPPLHVLRIVAGPGGEETGGGFRFTEERSIFSRSDDREVVVLFQWDGTAGPHKLVAHWRSPDGALSSTSAIDYVAQDRRFGAYWQLPLSPSMPTGTWTIEATVDGQPGGRFTFEVRDEKVVTPVVKRPLTEPALYQQLERLFVMLERSTTDGYPLDVGAGLRTGDGRILTAMAVLDGTDSITALSSSKPRRAVDAVLAWNRADDWAILADPAGGLAGPGSLPALEGATVSVGARCFSMEAGSPQARVLIEGAVSGHSRDSDGTRRLIVRWLNGSGTTGAPVVNEFGEVIGILGGGFPGASRLSDVLRARAHAGGAVVVPLGVVQPAAGRGGLIASLQSSGELILPVTGAQHVLSGGFAKQIVRGPSVMPADQREQFVHADKTFVTFVTWHPQERLRGRVLLRVYDAGNRLVLESKPMKGDFRRGQLSLSSWQLPVPNAPGLYRTDVLIDDKPIWRGFVTITG